jgi:hypothetical protein
MPVYVVSGPCVVCREPFVFNPFKVPSVTVLGVREPICRRCVDLANPWRVANGLAPIVPAPGSYEPVDVLELDR